MSSGETTWDVEALLGDVLRPIEPPERLSGRIEDTFTALSAAAATELSDWAEELSDSELRALRDPRNWVRPVVAVGVGGVATGALVLFELRRRGRQEAKGGPRRSDLASAGAGGPFSHNAGRFVQRRLLAAPAVAGLRRREAQQAKRQVQGFVSTSRREEAEDRGAGGRGPGPRRRAR